MSILKNLIIITIVIYLILGVLLYIKQRDILYIPSAPIETPFEVVHFKHNGVDIKSFVVNPKKEDAIIYFGGNAESVAYSVQNFATIFSDYTLYFVNYRSYGGSSGEPTEQGIYSDALFIYDQLKQQHQNINVIGRSLGSGVATYLASERQINRLVLVTPFDSIRAVAQARFPIYPMSLVLKDSYDSLSRVPKITAQKTLIISGGEDRTIPPIHTKRLSDAFAPHRVDRLNFPTLGHNNISSEEGYYLGIKKFIEF